MENTQVYPRRLRGSHVVERQHTAGSIHWDEVAVMVVRIIRFSGPHLEDDPLGTPVASGYLGVHVVLSVHAPRQSVLTVLKDPSAHVPGRRLAVPAEDHRQDVPGSLWRFFLDDGRGSTRGGGCRAGRSRLARRGVIRRRASGCDRSRPRSAADGQEEGNQARRPRDREYAPHQSGKRRRIQGTSSTRNIGSIVWASGDS